MAHSQIRSIEARLSLLKDPQIITEARKLVKNNFPTGTALLDLVHTFKNYGAKNILAALFYNCYILENAFIPEQATIEKTTKNKLSEWLYRSMKEAVKEDTLSAEEVETYAIDLRYVLQYCELGSLFMYLWEIHGRQIYHIYPSLSWAFLNTKLDDLPSEYVTLPYPCIIISPLEDIYIDDKKIDQILVAQVEPNWLDITLTLYGQDIAPICHCGKCKASPEIIILNRSFNLHAPTVGESVALNSNEENWNTTLGILYYIINCVLYITSAESDDILRAASIEYLKLERKVKTAHGAKKKTLQERLKKLNPRYVHLIGSKTIVDRKYSKEEEEDNTTESFGAKRVAHLVCGHWRHYWTGEGRKILVRKRIEPFWRGTPTDEQVKETKNRSYLVR